MKIISTHTFKHILRDIHKKSSNRNFCFIIGAGASYKSGIPTGGQLANGWFKEIQYRSSTKEFEQWIADVKLDKNDLAAHYGDIYRKRFEYDKTSGYEFLIQAMRDAKPSFGHFVLAQILTKVPESCVLTTNFDSLVESSIYQYTDKTPLVCGHESLSGYARPSKIHPLIIKIHRDLLLAPMSEPNQINALDKAWKEPLDNIFSTHIPIIIGYGGNDGSLMTYFEQMNKPSNFFWCGLANNPPSNHIKELVAKMGGCYVEIDGFDQLMHELLWVFDEIKPADEELETITKSRLEAMKKQLTEMKNKPSTTNATETNTVKELSAFEYANLADNEPDYEKRKTIYLEALEKFPNTAWLWNKFTYFLQWVKKDYSNLNDYYLKALSIDPEYAMNIGNYAAYLFDIKKDYENAEKYYLKALAIDPKNANINGNYANYLCDIKKDYENAEKYYLKALAIDPENENNNGNYAVFLKEIKKDYENAEKYYLKALSIDPNSENKNGNYAKLLLITNRQNEATTYVEKAFELNKNEENGLLLELWFYRFAHYPEWLDKAEQAMEQLLEKGIQSIGWDFSQNIEIAIANNHPKPDKLKELAKRITEK